MIATSHGSTVSLPMPVPGLYPISRLRTREKTIAVKSPRNAPKTIEFSPKTHPARPSPDLRRPTPIIQKVLKTSQSSLKRRSPTKNYIFHPEISMLYRPPRGVEKTHDTERYRLDWPWNSDLAADLLHRFHDRGGERNSFSPVFLHPCKALLTMHIDPVLTLRLRRFLQLPRKTIHISLELVQRTKRGRINRHEKVPDVRLRLVNIHAETRRRTAQDTAEHIHHQSKPVALVP